MCTSVGLSFFMCFLAPGGATMCWGISCRTKRSMWSWCVCAPCRGRSTWSSWTASGTRATAAGWASTPSRPSVSVARWVPFVPFCCQLGHLEFTCINVDGLDMAFKVLQQHGSLFFKLCFPLKPSCIFNNEPEWSLAMLWVHVSC